MLDLISWLQVRKKKKKKIAVYCKIFNKYYKHPETNRY